MPIKIPAGLPAASILEGENVSTIEEERALHQDIRPLQIAVLNLMPTKIETETQLIRLLSHNSLQIELTLITTASHRSTHVPPEHMKSFYKTFDQIKDKKFDGLLITGAPVEELKYEDVDYWQELTEIMKWSNTNVYSTFHICWAAQAALYFYYGIEKYKLEEKLFGVYKHKVRDKNHPLLRGFDDVFYAPHSRHTDVHTGDIEREENLFVT